MKREKEKKLEEQIDEKKISRERILGWQGQLTRSLLLAVLILSISCDFLSLFSANERHSHKLATSLCASDPRFWKKHARTHTHQASSSWFSRCFRAIFASSSRGKEYRRVKFQGRLVGSEDRSSNLRSNPLWKKEKERVLPSWLVLKCYCSLCGVNEASVFAGWISDVMFHEQKLVCWICGVSWGSEKRLIGILLSERQKKVGICCRFFVPFYVNLISENYFYIS